MNFYQQRITEILVTLKRPEVPANCVEGSMRLMYSTLSHLPRSVFVQECKLAIEMYDLDPVEFGMMGESFGL